MSISLGELLESGIVIEGWRKIQCWENEDNPTVYHEGYDEGDLDEHWNAEVAYVFPYTLMSGESALCIELAEPALRSK